MISMVLGRGRAVGEPKRLPRWLGGLLGACLVIAFWEGMATLTFGGRHVIPTPQSVLVTIFHDPGYSVWANLGVTAPEAGLGWLAGNLAALALAGLFILLPAVEGPLMKLALASYCLPITAIGAILYVVLPTGADPRIAVSALSVIFTTLVGAMMGLRSADPASLDLVRAYGGGKWAQLVKVRFKSALPATFAGLAIAGPASVLGAIIGEYLGGATGLGATMVLAQQDMDVQRVWAIATVSTALAGAAFLLTTLVGRLLAPWAIRAQRA
ncbi:MAG TPA: ABC transporter permease subunit [Acidimicrobiales bacterium]|nr:ABC transporter permease subunit [Acidimicrobiales bacterium]